LQFACWGYWVVFHSAVCFLFAVHIPTIKGFNFARGSFIEWRCGLVYCRKAPTAFPAYVLLAIWVWVIGRLEGLRFFAICLLGLLGGFFILLCVFYSLYIYQPLRVLIFARGSFIEWRCGLVYCRKAPLTFPAYDSCK